MLLAIAVVVRAFARGNAGLGRFPSVPVQPQKNPGETMVAHVIGSQFNRPHRLLNNVTLPTADGTTQIDHVLIADTGIFVIETKHYSGWIFGNPKDDQWTQMINRKKICFQNPLRQNYGHVKTLQSLCDLPAESFHTVVVFTGNAEFKTDLGPDVVQLSGLMSLLSANRPVLLDEARRTYVIDRIEHARLPCSDETDEFHNENVRRKVAAKNRSVKTTLSCPLPAANAQSFNANARYMPKA